MLTIRDEIFRLYSLHAQRIFECWYEQGAKGCDENYPITNLNQHWPIDPLIDLFTWAATKEGQYYWDELCQG